MDVEHCASTRFSTWVTSTREISWGDLVTQRDESNCKTIIWRKNTWFKRKGRPGICDWMELIKSSKREVEIYNRRNQDVVMGMKARIICKERYNKLYGYVFLFLRYLKPLISLISYSFFGLFMTLLIPKEYVCIMYACMYIF